MRRILLALAALAFMVPAAEAARRDESGNQQASSRSAQVQTAHVQRGKAPAARRSARNATTARQASRARSTTLRLGDVRTSRSGVAVHGAAAATVSRDAVASSCTRRSGRRSCGRATSSIAGWQSGLPQVDYAQTECPDGTFATLARGHDDVVRCMPL